MFQNTTYSISSANTWEKKTITNVLVSTVSDVHGYQIIDLQDVNLMVVRCWIKLGSDGGLQEH